MDLAQNLIQWRVILYGRLSSNSSTERCFELLHISMTSAFLRHWTDSEEGPFAVPCEHGNEPSWSIKGRSYRECICYNDLWITSSGRLFQHSSGGTKEVYGKQPGKSVSLPRFERTTFQMLTMLLAVKLRYYVEFWWSKR
jgi:hypothetical protein